MIDEMKTLLKNNSMCVLATSAEDRPHCSLMAYVADEEARTVYMVTRRSSRKYRNMERNPHVSILVDTRTVQGDRAKIQALTVSGVFSPLHEASERASALGRIMTGHPHLASLLKQPDIEVIAVQVTSFLLLDGAVESHFETMDHSKIG